jgi:hypothetical protein
MPKYLHWIGLAACITLIISCFIPWTYYADLNKSFTGFFSEHNEYGKPGMFLVPLTIIFFILMWIPKVWAKRTNLFLGAIIISYGIKSYVLFTSCYNAYCPEKQAGIFIMLLSTIVIMLAAIFPHVELKEEKK